MLGEAPMPGLNDSAAEPTWPISLQGRRVGARGKEAQSAWRDLVPLNRPPHPLPKPHLHSSACWACLACMRYSQP